MTSVAKAFLGGDLAVLAAIIGLAGCASAGAPAPPRERFRDTPAALSEPEPDPGCRLTARARLVANGLEQVTIRVEVDRAGKLLLVQFLAPDLSASAKLELRRAYEQCAWKPALGPGGEPVDAGATLVEHR